MQCMYNQTPLCEGQSDADRHRTDVTVCKPSTRQSLGMWLERQ